MFGFSPSAIIKGLAAVAIVGLLMFGLKSCNQYLANEKAEAQALLDATQLAQEEANKVDRLTSALNIQTSTAEAAERAREAADVAAKEANKKFQDLREEANAQKRIFQEHDIGALLAAKPELIINAANRATADRFRQVESILDGN